MKLSKSQQEICDTLFNPVIVQAGAGSGKTFTMSERIVSSLTPDASGKSKVSSIENVVAITFTEKAASELKSRVKDLLLTRGMHSQALLVDSAYISTIHEFASRILKENALKFAIDPKFNVLSDAKVDCLRDLALDKTLELILNFGSSIEDILSSEEFGSSQNRDINLNDFEDEVNDFISVENQNAELSQLSIQSIKEMIYASDNLAEFLELKEFISSLGDGDFKEYCEKIKDFVGIILSKTSAMEDGLDGVISEFKSFSPQDILNELILSSRQLQNYIASLMQTSPENLSKHDLSFFDGLNSFLIDASNFLEDMHENSVDDFNDDYFALIDKLPFPRKDLFKKCDDLDEVDDFKTKVSKLIVESFCSANFSFQNAIVKIANLSDLVFREILGRSRLTMDELVEAATMSLDKCPDVANFYKNKFEMIVVDEFQDTNKLQVALIEKIARASFQNVCVVGDVQQSIYRFRGGDVHTFSDYKKNLVDNKLSDCQLKVFNLNDNYRSHKDILTFSERIFSSKDMFGDDFLKLSPKASINNETDEVFSNRPRILFDINHYTNRKNNAKGVVALSTQEVAEIQAKKIANHFKELVELGESPSSMALLLSSMTNANIYRKALNDVGIQCVVSGSKGFAQSNEVKLFSSLIRIARNILDDEALLDLLKFKLFNFSDSMLLVAGYSSDDKNAPTYKKTSISSQILSPDKSLLTTLTDEEKNRFSFASCLIEDFLGNIEVMSLDGAIREFLLQMGLFDYLEEQGVDGLVSGGYIEKCFSILEDITINNASIAHVCEEFLSYVAYSKESPTMLSSLDSEFLNIMTVHKSKGLQFAHVVISEINDGSLSSHVERKFIVENAGENTIVGSILPYKNYKIAKKWIDFAKTNCDICESDIDFENFSCGEAYLYLNRVQTCEAAEEAKRLLYVAITRAEKSLFISSRFDSIPADNTFSYSNIFSDIYNTLKWDIDCKKAVQSIDYGAEEPLKLNFEVLGSFDENAEQSEIVGDKESNQNNFSISNVKTKEFYVPKREKRFLHTIEPVISFFGNFLSYSQLDKLDSEELRILLKPILKNRISVNDDDVVSNDQFYNNDVDSASEFGSKLHKYMERLILTGASNIEKPNTKRLKNCVEKIISSEDFIRIANMDKVEPELQFCIPIKVNRVGKFYLRGAIDLVGSDATCASVIDYKTGKFTKNHQLQAIVYAYALLKSGYKKVDITFLHCEIEYKKDGSAYCQSYNFDADSLYFIELDLFEVINLYLRGL